MADRKRGLGRGFDSLIPTAAAGEGGLNATTVVDESGQRPVVGEAIHELGLEMVDPNPYQPRKDFNQDELEALAASIRVHGILQPLVVTKTGARYQLIAGERRLRAAKLAGLAVVPVIVRSFDEQQKLELAIIENIQRSELNPLELAAAYRQLVDEFNETVNHIAEQVGYDVSRVYNTMRLLNLSTDAKQALVSGKITEGHAMAILGLAGEPEKQAYLLELILKKKLSSTQAIEYARGLKGETGSKMKAQARIQAVSQLTMDLGDFLGAKVTQQRTSKGGKLIIEYYSEEELERIYKVIRREE